MARAVPIAVVCIVWLAVLTSHVAAQDSPFPPSSALAGKNAGDFALKPGQYGRYPAEWGLILVPENRNRERSRLIRLPFVRIRAQERAQSEPLFLLNGGPGDSNVFGNDPAPAFCRDHDLVMVGYRGVDGSVQLKDPEVGEALTVANPLSPAGQAHIRSALKSANRRLRDAGIDIDGYTLLEVVDDMEAVRKALSYERINLFSISFGTLAAHTYCRRYGDAVHRCMMVGAGHVGRPLAWEPSVVDKLLREYGDLWKSDPAALARSADIISTIRNVLGTLPRRWQHIDIDPDKVRVATFHMLYETETAAMVFDAFVAAEKGDYVGLALLSRGYDEEVGGEGYWCEFFSKTISTGLQPPAHIEAANERHAGLLGSPLAKLIWGPASHGGWMIAPIPDEYRRPAATNVDTLVLMGSLDLAAPLPYVRELMAFLPKGRLVVVSGLGHNEVVRVQRSAFEHLMQRFLAEGAVDDSLFSPAKPCFVPRESLSDIARRTLATQPASPQNP